MVAEEALQYLRLQNERATREQECQEWLKVKTVEIKASYNVARLETSDVYGWKRTRNLESSLRKKEAILSPLKDNHEWHTAKSKI